MKQMFGKLPAALCTVMMLCSIGNSTVHAEEESEEILLPSGNSLAVFQLMMEQIPEENRSGDRFFASAAVGLFQGDEVLLNGYYGETDIENQIAANEDSVYEWGSVSKTLIWVSVMQLWEQGKIDLEHDVREYLPDGFFQHLSYNEPITMLNLMNHNAGWQETMRPIWKTDKNDILSLREELQAIEPAQIHRPGEVTAYSNYGAAVAGYVVECITGQDYCEYVHEHIFEPLGMEHTALNPSHSDNAWVQEQRRQVKSYRFSLGNTINLGSRLNYVPAYPAGAATGTLTDLMTYAQALVDETAPLFQNPETQAMMFTGTDFYGNSDIPMCAHGFWCEEHAVRIYGHNGGTTAGQANMVFDPDSKTGLVVMVNEPDGNWYMNYTSDLVFGGLSPEKYASGTVTEAEFDGFYMPARSNYRGMLKFMSYLSAISANDFGDIQNLGNGVYQIIYPDNISLEDNAILLGTKTVPDGRTVLRQPSCDLLHESFYLVKLCLFTVYILTAVAAVYLLRIRHKQKRHGKFTPYYGLTIMTAGQIARFISVLALLASYMIFAQFSGGIPFAAGAVIGIAQMICLLVCGISAVSSCYFIFSEKENKARPYRYILNTIGCALTVTGILFFEMYRFWGC